MSIDRLFKALLLVLVLAAGVWVAQNTEWVEVDSPTPAKGEAITNRFYATQQLVRQLGAKVMRPTGLASMPPKQATLLLSAWHWDLFPERERLLRAWVQNGGHLVIGAEMLNNERLQAWLPIASRDGEDEEDTQDQQAASAPAALPASAVVAAMKKRDDDCDQVVEPEDVKPAYGDRRTFKLCGGHGYPRLKQAPVALWAVEGEHGLDMLRVAVGRGSVTVFTTTGLFSNSWVLKGDNPLLAMATLQVRRGSEVWFVSEEARPPLLEWIWTQGWVAVLLGLLALISALWRGAVRFGPQMAQSKPGRRSIAEQVQGTAQFLKHNGASALHAAQVRALNETAQSRLRDYNRLDRASRAQAIATATGLDADTLTRALDVSLKRSDRELAPTLQVLETAHRHLAEPRPQASSTDPSRP